MVEQQITIRTQGATIRRELHRDLQGRRHPKQPPLDARGQQVLALLDEAHVAWNDPLSAADYKEWHDHLSDAVDRVQSAGSGLLTLSTTAQDAVVEEESLTLRASDLHPVQRTIEFRDRQVIEIAELSYSVLPWTKEREQWFEPDAAMLPAIPSLPARAGGRLKPSLSDAELNEAELHVLLTLKQLHADTERLQISRRPTGIEVRGVVGTDDRKRQIAAALLGIGHVSSDISSYRDMDRLPAPADRPSPVSVVSVQSDMSPIEAYCEQNHVDRESCRQASYTLLNSATEITRESSQIESLLRDHASPSILTPDAEQILHTLLAQDIANIQASLVQQQDALASLHYSPQQSQQAAPESADTLTQAARTNLLHSKELLYPGLTSGKATDATLGELARSFTQIRDSLTHLPGVVVSSSLNQQSTQTPQP